jgi:hypothetical protein
VVVQCILPGVKPMMKHLKRKIDVLIVPSTRMNDYERGPYYCKSVLMGRNSISFMANWINGQYKGGPIGGR